METSQTGYRLFISYSHADKKPKEELVRQFNSVSRFSNIIEWNDKQIAQGDNWAAEIDAQLAAADAAVLIVSDHFYDSEFISGVELPAILKRHEHGSCRIFVVHWDSVAGYHMDDRLRFIQAANSPDAPMRNMRPAKRKTLLSGFVRDVADRAAEARQKKHAGADIAALSDLRGKITGLLDTFAAKKPNAEQDALWFSSLIESTRLTLEEFDALDAEDLWDGLSGLLSLRASMQHRPYLLSLHNELDLGGLADVETCLEKLRRTLGRTCNKQSIVDPNDIFGEPAPKHAPQAKALLEAIKGALERTHELPDSQRAKACIGLEALRRKITDRTLHLGEVDFSARRLAQLKTNRLDECVVSAQLLLGRCADKLPPKAIFRDLKHGPEMVVIPAGQYLMGSPITEEGRHPEEGPQHEVVISRRFAVGRYPVTFAEWDAFVADTGYDTEKHVAAGGDEGWGRDRRPVINVSWEDAKAHAAWLSRRSDRLYRLLSESEWEYACRAGTTTPFSFGETISTAQANYDGHDTYGTGEKSEYRGQTTPVGTFPGNAFGLHDMHGNVWEWVEDHWIDSYANNQPDTEAPRTTIDSVTHVVRGGSWLNNPRILRSANRYFRSSGDRHGNQGFRVARTL